MTTAAPPRQSASFVVDVDESTLTAFATLSGDWNPLHTDAAHASRTMYGRRVLHGAFSAGLASRLAGMHLPGRLCLLHNLTLRFVAPIRPPARLTVLGEQVSGDDATGRVQVTVSDADTGVRYVDGAYEFSLHEAAGTDAGAGAGAAAPATAGAASVARALAPGVATPLLVTGASGGLGRAVLARLGARAIGLSRAPREGMLSPEDVARLDTLLDGRRLGGIVHCGWPAPDNERLVRLGDAASAVEFNVAAPLREVIGLAQLMARHGAPDAMLVLVGSTAAAPGRHNYRMPLYTLGKALLPELTRILALELGAVGQRCATLVFDVIEAGMNQRLSPTARLAHADRSPSGRIPGADDAAAQVAWLLDNRGFLVNGAIVQLTGGAIP